MKEKGEMMENEKIKVPLSQEFIISGGCPMCENGTLLVQFEGWEEVEAGSGLMKGIGLTRAECSNEPDIESDEWDEFENWHGDMPYVNWLPRLWRLEELLNEKYIFDESLEKGEPIILTYCEPKTDELKEATQKQGE